MPLLHPVFDDKNKNVSVREPLETVEATAYHNGQIPMNKI